MQRGHFKACERVYTPRPACSVRGAENAKVEGFRLKTLRRQRGLQVGDWVGSVCALAVEFQ